jgi:hypothetical protein
MILPSLSGPATQWQLYDYGQTFTNTDAPASGGLAVATIATVPADQFWMVDLVRVKSADSDQTSRAYICIDDVDRDVSGTATGAYDVADQSSPIHVPPGSVLMVVWRGIPDGLQANAYVQWTVLKSSTMGG